MTQAAAGGHIPVVILTGLSGAGKSTALKVFEDLGFLSVDGMPPGLIPDVVRLFDSQAELHHRGLTLGMDVRQSDFLVQWKETLSQCAALGIRPRIVFVESSRAVLLRRYAATRRPHPLEGALSLEAAMDREREMLAPVREQAELVLDTSGYSIHDLRRTLQEKWNFLRDKRWGLRLYILSFGFKHGVPTDADLVFDLRFLPNPHFDEALRPLSGQDEDVSRFVLGREPGAEFLRRQLDYLNFVLPLYAREGRYRMTVAFGCTGGRHRSVAVAEAVFDSLRNSDYAVFLEHRHIDLK
ncbi:RNase adapter RapZ [Desulfocurvus sp.]|uniref:RNase adapter RapZ n=1 Tax=Desulfocurvus sp. TaxID=2871698 RepID=UPI0025BF1CCB|nr:RNase adapter RapZ [Desulfocurvus sp.]MCK9240800.1 RNase adapter RapZ [Desulfocurvus sp.]